MNTLPHLTQLLDRHLTDEQLFTLLDAPGSTGASLNLHLSACAECRSELSTVRTSLGNFRDAATSLASAQRSQHRVMMPAKTSRSHRLIWSASLAMAGIVFAASVSLVRPSGHANQPAVIAAQPISTTVSDEALMDGIQQDLATSIPPSLEPLAVPAASSMNQTSN